MGAIRGCVSNGHAQVGSNLKREPDCQNTGQNRKWQIHKAAKAITNVAHIRGQVLALPCSRRRSLIALMIFTNLGAGKLIEMPQILLRQGKVPFGARINLLPTNCFGNS